MMLLLKSIMRQRAGGIFSIGLKCLPTCSHVFLKDQKHRSFSQQPSTDDQLFKHMSVKYAHPK